MPQATGKVLFITRKENVSKKEGKEFFKQALGLECQDEVNGNVYTSVFKFEFTNDNCAKLNGIVKGEKIRVTYGIRGNSITKTTPVEANGDLHNGVDDIIVSLNGTNIERQAQQQPINPAQVYNPPATQQTSSANDDLPF